MDLWVVSNFSGAAWYVARQLVKLDPTEPHNYYNATVTSLSIGAPFLAYAYAETYLQRWQKSELSDQMVEMKTMLDQACAEIVAGEAHLQSMDYADLALMDESRMLIDTGNYDDAESVLKQATKRLPQMAMFHNNLSFVTGNTIS